VGGYWRNNLAEKISKRTNGVGAIGFFLRSMTPTPLISVLIFTNKSIVNIKWKSVVVSVRANVDGCSRKMI